VIIKVVLISQHWSGGTLETRKKLNHYCRSVEVDLSPGHSEGGAKILSIQTRHYVISFFRWFAEHISVMESMSQILVKVKKIRCEKRWIFPYIGRKIQVLKICRVLSW